MSSGSKIADVRMYAGRWLVCDVFLQGQAKWSWTYCHGRLGYLRGPEWLMQAGKTNRTGFSGSSMRRKLSSSSS